MNLRCPPNSGDAEQATGNSRSLVAALAYALLLSTAVSGPLAAARADNLELDTAAASEPVATSADEKSYRSLIEELESDQGAYADGLPEQLLSLGLALQRDERHQSAVEVFKRGVHLARINNGLYSPRQLPLLQAQINSHVASGQYREADERQHYMYRVQMRSLDSGQSKAEAFMQQAAWQYNAYQLALDPEGHGRLMSMWDLYRLAVRDIADREGRESPNLRPPLEGMLRAQYLISRHRVDSSLPGLDGYSVPPDQNRFKSYRSESYRKGKSVALAMHELEVIHHGKDSVSAAQSTVMLGDWMRWHGQVDSATLAWQEAIGELAGRDDAEQAVAQLFGEPVALPDIDGLRPLPPPVPPAEGTLQVAFGVTALGEVVNMERVDNSDIEKHKVNRLLRTLRRTAFRPRFEGAMPVITERLVWAYDIR